jgi:hypothetical protein
MSTMPRADETSFFKITRLSLLNWQRDGCPPGRDLEYWREAEREFKARRAELKKSGPRRAQKNATRRT